jgi:mgtE-like transporter
VAERLAAAPARLARRARRLLGYWRSERRTLRQGAVALTISTGAGFVAGLTLAHITPTLEALPGLIVLIPAAVGMKGTIFGAIGARIGTASAAGTFQPTLESGGELRRNVWVALLTTLTSSVWLALLARLVSAALGGPSISIWSLLAISVVGGALGSAFILLLTVGLAVVSHRRRWDLDAVATPMVTALGDMTTLPFLFLATFLVRDAAVRNVTVTVCIVGSLLAVARLWATGGPVVRRIVVEMTGVILLTPVLDVLAGGLLREWEPSLLAVPVLLSLIPPFVSQAGALGGIFSSRITSKLQIGVITPRGLPEVPAVIDASLVMAFAVAVFAMIGVVAFGLGEITGLAGMPSATALIGATVLAGLLVAPLTIVSSYYLAVSTYRFGLDPDNQTIPIITSLMDLVGVAAILFVMRTSGVLP